jgi:hypothetical protein
VTTTGDSQPSGSAFDGRVNYVIPIVRQHWVRRHWMVATLLTAGLLLRIMTQLAYQPAMLYIDSKKYLISGWGGFDPLGYTLLLLHPVLLAGNLAVVATVQHLLGIAMAVTLYVLLLRFGAPRWGAALATAPVLLDAYQLQTEQTIMPDVLFEALIVAGLAVLLWRRRPSLILVEIAGLLLGASAPVRQVGEVLIVPALAYVLLATPGWRRRLGHAAVLTVAFALPVLGYMTYSQFGLHEHFQLSNMGNDMLYGRAAHAVDCATLKIPAYERPLCPSPSVAASLGVDQLVNSPESPGQTYKPSNGIDAGLARQHFAFSVFEQQPLRVLGDITQDSVKIFALTRDQAHGDTPIWRWQFQTVYPTYPPGITAGVANVLFKANGGGKATVDKPFAAALRHYQLGGGYTPGPVFLLTLLAGLGGILTYRRGRSPGLPLACLLITGLGVAALLGADFYEFSWRYQLPALITLPAAGTLGAVAIAERIRERRQRPARPDSGLPRGRFAWSCRRRARKQSGRQVLGAGKQPAPAAKQLAQPPVPQTSVR